MSYSALTHRWPVFVLLLATCVWLRQWDTPVEAQSWARLAVDWTLVAVFLAVALPLRRLGGARAAFFRDHLGRWFAPFCARLQAEGGPVYGEAAGVLEGFLSLEAQSVH